MTANEQSDVLTTYVVSIYEVDKAYGGPEEGGWYYTYGSPSKEHLRYMRVFETDKEAIQYCEELRTTVLTELNKGKRPISSVLSEGQYIIRVNINELPKPFPETRPYYE